MGFQLLDGKGSGRLAEVNLENELVVRAILEKRIEHFSVHNGTSFSWDSGERDIDAGDTMLFVKNTGGDLLICDRLIVNGSNVICTWDVNVAAATTTPSGSTVTAVNLNGRFSSTAPDATSLFDETAVADGSTVMRVKTPVTNTLVLDLAGIVLNKNQYLQVNQETESTSGSVILLGHFEAQ